MPGSIPFGTGRFGRPDLGAALYAGLPEWMRTRDTGDLEWLFGALGAAWNEIYDAGAIIDQVDPATARGDDEVVEVEVTSASGADGLYVVVVADASKLLGVRRGWQFSAAAFGSRRMLVIEPRADTGELVLRGGDIPAPGPYVLRGQAMLPQVVQALGLDVDGVAGDAVVRTWALRSWWWQAARGSDAAIEFVARLYGFDVEIRRLWAMTAAPDILAGGDYFTGDDGRIWSRVPLYVADDTAIKNPDAAALVGFAPDYLPLTANALEWDCEVVDVGTFDVDGQTYYWLDLSPGAYEPMFVAMTLEAGEDPELVEIIRDPSRWYVVDAAGERHWFEFVPDLFAGGVTLYVAGTVEPVTGAGTIAYHGIELCTPDFHRASAIELVFTEAGAAGTAAGTDLMYARAVRALAAVLAAHVEVVATSLEA